MPVIGELVFEGPFRVPNDEPFLPQGERVREKAAGIDPFHPFQEDLFRVIDQIHRFFPFVSLSAIRLASSRFLAIWRFLEMTKAFSNIAAALAGCLSVFK